MTVAEGVSIGLGFLAIVAPDFWPKMPRPLSYILAAIGLAWLTYSGILAIQDYTGMKLQNGPLAAIIFGVICIAGGLFWHISRINSTKPTAVETATHAARSAPKYKSLAQLFETDFPNAQKAIFDTPVNWTSRDGKTKTSAIPLRSAAYVDASAKAEFVGFYIPHSEHTYDLIAYALQTIDKIRADAHDRAPVLYDNSMHPTHIRPEEYSFTGRVFIYHEDELSPAQVGRLWGLYKSKGMAVEFRSQSYAADVWSKAP